MISIGDIIIYTAVLVCAVVLTAACIYCRVILKKLDGFCGIVKNKKMNNRHRVFFLNR